MDKLTGFIEYVRETNPMRPEEERVKDWKRSMSSEKRKRVRHKVRAVWIVVCLFVIVEK